MPWITLMVVFGSWGLLLLLTVLSFMLYRPTAEDQEIEP